MGIKFNKNYAIDIHFLCKQRLFKDGISFFELVSNLDLYKGDHNPKFYIYLILFNFVIFDMEIYNVNHLKQE